MNAEHALRKCREAVEKLGGEKVFAEMLNKGRVFRFKWGGQ